MSIREKLNENQNAVVVVAVVIIITALIFIIWRSAGGGGGRVGDAQVYYVDTVTNEVFEADADLIPPIESPDGNEAVRVYLFTCNDNDCSKSERFIGYYEKFTPDAKRMLEEQREQYEEGGPEGADEQAMYEVYEQTADARLHALHREGIDLRNPNVWGPALDGSIDLEEQLTCDDGERARHCFPR